MASGETQAPGFSRGEAQCRRDMMKAFVKQMAVAKGAGEIANSHVAPAIANAVSNACGVRIQDLPLRPARILKELCSSLPPEREQG